MSGAAISIILIFFSFIFAGIAVFFHRNKIKSFKDLSSFFKKSISPSKVIETVEVSVEEEESK